MVVKRRLLIAAASAAALVLTAAVPAAASFHSATPSPVRSEKLIRVKDMAANGSTKSGPIAAIGWREESKPGQLYVAFSTNGGKDYRRSSGKLRRYPVLGDGRLGMSVDVCAGRVWVGTAFHRPGDDLGDTDVLLTTRTIGGGAAQAFMTDTSIRRRVQDVSVTCVGNDLIAVAWLEKSFGKSKAKLLLRSVEELGSTPSFQKIYGLGEARFNDGIDVAGTSKAVHVAWTKGTQQNIRLQRFLLSELAAISVDKQDAVTIAFKAAVRPHLAARGGRVAIAYTDAGKVKVKLSENLGADFGKATTLTGFGSTTYPSAAYAIDVYGDRVVVEAGANKKGTVTPKRFQTTDFGGKWGARSFGHQGARVGAIIKKRDKPPLMVESWHNNASTGNDTLRAQYEKP